MDKNYTTIQIRKEDRAALKELQKLYHQFDQDRTYWSASDVLHNAIQKKLLSVDRALLIWEGPINKL